MNKHSYSFLFDISIGRKVMKKEREFQPDLIKEIKGLFPGCIVQKLDSSYIQGIPDLLILFGKHWAILECKKSDKEKFRPNQEYYIDILNKMSFSRMICPENKEEVLNDLQQAFRNER